MEFLVQNSGRIYGKAGGPAGQSRERSQHGWKVPESASAHTFWLLCTCCIIEIWALPSFAVRLVLMNRTCLRECGPALTAACSGRRVRDEAEGPAEERPDTLAVDRLAGG